MSATPFCGFCGNDRPGDLLEVTDRRTGERRWCCRPGTGSGCFGQVARTADVDAIALLVPERPTVSPMASPPQPSASSCPAAPSPSALRWRARHARLAAEAATPEPRP